MANIDDNAQGIIFKLLNDAASAHGVYEKEVLGGVYHDEWAEWYAQHMAAAFAAAGYRIVQTDA